MKKAISIVLILFLSIQSFSQQINPPSTLTQQDYLQKSKKQKKAAWILLIGGTTLIGVSSILLFTSSVNEFASIFDSGHDNGSFAAATVLFCTGAASTIASIPLFVIASKNKKNALSVSSSFKMEATPQLFNKSFVYKPLPSLSLKINL